LEKKIKTNVRLFKAEDAIWMCLPEELRDRTPLLKTIDDKGFYLEFKKGVARCDWKTAASILGKDRCELVKSPEGANYVLVYDEEKINKKGN
jgi:hypothetical protein